MTKRPLEQEESEEQERAAKRLRYGPLVEGSLEELRSRLEAAGTVAKRAATFLAEQTTDGKLSVVTLQRFSRTKETTVTDQYTMTLGGFVTMSLEFGKEHIELPDALVVLKGKSFPLMSSSIVDDRTGLTLYDNALKSWDRCETYDERRHLVKFVEEMSHQLVRCEERVLGHGTLIADAMELFKTERASSKVLLPAKFDERFASFGTFSFAFPSTFEGQQRTLAFLEAAIRLVS
jgi:hypothetical protein